jgi:Outer membrane lipoprotein-sorting protein
MKPALILIATLLLSATSAAAASAADAHAALSRPLHQVQSSDFRATGHLVRVDAFGVRTSRGITIKAHWFPGVLRVLGEITSPAEARAHILIEFRPTGQSSIQIVHPGDKSPATLPFDRWTEGPLGPGFSYEDFLEAQYFWPEQSMLPPAKYGARDCDIVRSAPGAGDRSHYARIDSWLDQTTGYPVYVVKTLKSSGTQKEFTAFGLRKTGGVWSATQVEVKVHGQAGSTLLVIDRGSPNAKLDLKDFGPEQLNRF